MIFLGKFIDLMKITTGHSAADTPMSLGGVLIMVLFSIPFIAIGLWSIRKRNRILTEGFHTTALITRSERRYDRQATNARARDTYAPVIRFRDDRGKEVTRPIPYSFNIFEAGRPRSQLNKIFA